MAALDLDGLVRAYLRSIPADGATRTFFAIDRDGRFPQCILTPVLGSVDQATEMATTLAQIDVWGYSRQDRKPGGDRAATARLATALVAHLRAYDTDPSVPQFSSHGGRLVGITVASGPTFRPDPEAERPRYLIEASFHATPATT